MARSDIGLKNVGDREFPADRGRRMARDEPGVQQNDARHPRQSARLLPRRSVRARRRPLSSGPTASPIENHGADTVQLLRRTWHITDAHGRTAARARRRRRRRAAACSSRVRLSNTPPARRSPRPRASWPAQYHMVVRASGEPFDVVDPGLQPRQPARGRAGALDAYQRQYRTKQGQWALPHGAAAGAGGPRPHNWRKRPLNEIAPTERVPLALLASANLPRPRPRRRSAP